VALPELISANKRLDVALMSKVFRISTGQIAPEVHVAKEELVVMLPRQKQPTRLLSQILFLFS